MTIYDDLRKYTLNISENSETPVVLLHAPDHTLFHIVMHQDDPFRLKKIHTNV